MTSQPQSPKAASKLSHEARRSSEECVGSARIHRPITNRHGSSWFERFRSHFALFWSFWLAISEPGWTSRKKPHLESGLNQRDRATGGFVGVYTHRKPGKKYTFHCRGFYPSEDHIMERRTTEQPNDVFAREFGFQPPPSHRRTSGNGSNRAVVARFVL